MSVGQGVIFDVDGVLIDSYQSHFESWQRLAAEIGRTCSEAEFVKGFGRTSRENIVEMWSDQHWTNEQVRQLDDRKEWWYREIIREQFPAMPGAASLIRALHKSGFRIAVGSSGPPENVDLVIDRLDVAPMIACRITARDVVRGKPDPQVFELAAKGLGLPATACCVVEDAPAGIQASHAAGIVCIGLASTGRTRAELANAEQIVDSLVELTPEGIDGLIRAGQR
jgi:beta-phosphoglucomutase